MTFAEPEQRVRTGARRVRVERAVPMKFAAAAIIAALGIALIVTMGPSPASASAIVIRECGDHYVVTRYNADGSVKGVWNKQLSDEGTIYTAGKTWKLVEGDPDRFVSDGGAQSQVVACDATPGSGARGLGGVQQDGAQADQTSTTLLSNHGQASVATAIEFTSDYAQAFTTGSSRIGYRLTGVEMEIGTVGAQPSYSVSIHGDSSGVPGSRLGTLENPDSLVTGTGIEQFTASGDGIGLGADRTYWVVVDVAGGSAQGRLVTTASDAEDSGAAAAGWTIGNERRERGATATRWGTGTHTDAVKIAIEGYELTRAQLQESQYPAFSPFRDTLRDHYEAQCTRLRSLPSDPDRDYSYFDADGHRIQASNGWKWVHTRNSQGDITGSRPMTISECAGNKLHERQSFCPPYADRQGPVCPTLRDW